MEQVITLNIHTFIKQGFNKWKFPYSDQFWRMLTKVKIKDFNIEERGF